LWQIDEKAGPFPPAIQVPPVTVWKGIVYSDPTESDTLYAVNASTGTILWTYNTGGDNSNANIYSGNLWMVNSAGTLLVLNPTSGTLINETNVGGGLGPGNLIFAGQNVIICEQKGQVISIPVSNVLSTG
jgi:outer membrane protein assembly factor BamB